MSTRSIIIVTGKDRHDQRQQTVRLYKHQRDGFGSIVFYVGGAK